MNFIKLVRKPYFLLPDGEGILQAAPSTPAIHPLLISFFFPGSPKRRKGSVALKEETGVWNFQGGGKDKCLFSLHFLVLVT